MISSLDTTPKKVVLEQVYDILDDKENDDKPFIKFNQATFTKLKLVTPKSVNSSIKFYQSLLISNSDIDENCLNSTYESSIWDIYGLYQNLSIDSKQKNHNSNESINYNHLDLEIDFSIKPAIIPNYQINDKDPISLNFIRLLMTYNKLLKSVIQQNYQINLFNLQRKAFAEKNIHIDCNPRSDDCVIENLDRNYYFSSSTSDQVLNTQDNDTDEEFDDTDGSQD